MSLSITIGLNKMPVNVTPKKLQKAVSRGFDRFKNFRKARTMFLRNYVGQYYDQVSGPIGTEALNLTFSAIRTLVPNIVMNFPTHNVKSDYLYAKDYAKLLELALAQQDKRYKIRDVYRRVIVDAIFMLGILKTGIAEGDSEYVFDDNSTISVGEIFTEAVDFDNFVVDPNSKDHMFRDAGFLGDRMWQPREQLLESGLYRNDLLERLPRAGEYPKRDKAYTLSMGGADISENAEFQDEIEISEIWIPSANMIVTVPGAKDISYDNYLREDEYYGPDTGPYTLLALTPPVPGNPLPVSAVGVWSDLHVLANRMAKKIIDQAERQKDLVTYRRSAVDDAQEMLDAEDGDHIAVDDVDGVKVHSFGGQQVSNEAHLAQLTNWFNQMAANPEALGGQRLDADSATEARILQQNSSVHLEDMKDLVYQMAAEEAGKRAWYLHTDPLIDLPLIRRVDIPAQTRETPIGPIMEQPARREDIQVFLTPEARAGEWLDFTFSIEPNSMGRKDDAARFAEAMDFAVKIIPAAMQAAQTAMMIGLPFSPKAFIIRMAKDRGIDWMEEVFFDPEFQIRSAMVAQRGPAMEGSQGILIPNTANPMAAMLQNGQPGQVMSNPSTAVKERQEQQSGANAGQRQVKQEVR